MSETAEPAAAQSQSVPVRLVPRPLVTESAVGTAPPPAAGSGTVTITIDGRQVEVHSGQWIIQAADEAGVYIPRFCYHPRMKPVGMCRMCLVEVVGPRGSSLMPACYNPVADGMEIHTSSPMAKKAQEGVLEFLLVNHPLDCPVCDKGGECPLQDQTLAYGPGESRFVEEKRHWEKPIPISDLVYLDRERCIQCGRCVRFADEVAGDQLIDFAERGDETEVATFPGTPYASYFSGNVVQICPVGALTAKPYRFKARPWDLEQVESTCTTCSVGCRVAAQSSSGELTRLIGVDSDPVNWAWLCDKGRFAFAAATGETRVTVPLIRRGDELVESSWGEALAVAAEGLAAAKAAGGGSALAVIGGARLPNEDAYAWAKAARLALGTDNVDAQLGDGLPATTVLGLPRATIDEAAAAPLVITLGPDIKDELPVLYLRLRDAVREQGTQIVELTPAPTGLSPYAAETVLYRPGEIAALAMAVTSSGPVTGEVAGVAPETIDAVRAHITRAREKSDGGAPPVVVILGRASLAESEEQVAAAARVLAGLPGAVFLSALRRANVHGALDMGLAPGVLPGRVALEPGRAWFEHYWAAPLPAETGLTTAGILEAASRGHIGGLVLLGADPRSDFPDAQLALKGLLGARFVVAVDTHLTASSRGADVVLPAAMWAERRGTFTNLEGRITWLSHLVTARGVAWPDWIIASELAARLGVDLGFSSLEDVWDEIDRVSPLHQGVTYESLTGDQARDGLLVPISRSAAQPRRRPRPLDPMADPGIASAELHTVAPTAMLHAVVSTVTEPNGSEAPAEVASTGGPPAPTMAVAGAGAPEEAADAVPEPPDAPTRLGLPSVAPPVGPSSAGDRTSLRLVARRTLWDAGTQVQSLPALAGLHPEPRLVLHPAVLAELGTADGEAVRVTSDRGSLVIAATGDYAIPPGTAVAPWNLPGAHAGDLIDGALPFTEVRVDTVADGGGEAHG
ncbi:MAG TPA: NADH-quinone oxidoreductase subunit NuoG [Acidimicrobiales bacterium]